MAIGAVYLKKLSINAKKIRYYRLGRHALLFGLNLLRIRPGDAVLMPAFICRDLLAPIHAVGAIPIFYDVDRQLRPVGFSHTQNVRAVLAVNYFGFPQDLGPFRKYCLQHDAALIEDNAHGFLSQDSTGEILGERGDMGIFSMHKTFPLPDGAALSVNKPEWQAHLAKQLPCHNGFFPPDYWARYTLSKWQRRTGVPVLTMAKKMIHLYRYVCTGQEVPISDPSSEYTMPANPAPHCRTFSMLMNLDMSAEVARRRALYEKMNKLLTKENIEPIVSNLPKGVAPYGYPFYSDRESSNRVKTITRGLGMDCSHWPDLPAVVEPIASVHYRSLWFVNFFSE